MQHAAGDADGHGGKQSRLSQQHHACQAQHRAGHAVKQAHRRAEQHGHHEHPHQGDQHRFLPAQLIEHKDHGDIGEADLYPGDGHKGRDLALHEGEDHCQGDGQGQDGDLFCFHQLISSTSLLSARMVTVSLLGRQVMTWPSRCTLP